jgi:hypothetical protein
MNDISTSRTRARASISFRLALGLLACIALQPALAVTEAALQARIEFQVQHEPRAGTTAHPENGWSESMAQRIATKSGIRLSEAHWDVIRYVRDYYLEGGFARRSRGGNLRTVRPHTT